MSESGSFFGAIREKNEALEQLYYGPKKEDALTSNGTLKSSVSDEGFERMWGMTKREAYEKNLRDARELLEKEKTNKKDHVGNVFEKEDKLEEKIEAISLDNNKTSTIGIDLDVIKKMEKEGVKKEKEMNHDDMGMSGPSRTSSMNFL